jgi:signal transduction histidine kinase
LINDVLDLAKIEAGQLTLTLEDYALAEVVRSVVSATEPLATAKGLKFTAAVKTRCRWRMATPAASRRCS